MDIGRPRPLSKEALAFFMAWPDLSAAKNRTAEEIEELNETA
jgi:hypothetical protein